MNKDADPEQIYRDDFGNHISFWLEADKWAPHLVPLLKIGGEWMLTLPAGKTDYVEYHLNYRYSDDTWKLSQRSFVAGAFDRERILLPDLLPLIAWIKTLKTGLGGEWPDYDV